MIRLGNKKDNIFIIVLIAVLIIIAVLVVRFLPTLLIRYATRGIESFISESAVIQ